jgi:hypothetical protein
LARILGFWLFRRRAPSRALGMPGPDAPCGWLPRRRTPVIFSNRRIRSEAPGGGRRPGPTSARFFRPNADVAGGADECDGPGRIGPQNAPFLVEEQERRPPHDQNTIVLQGQSFAGSHHPGRRRLSRERPFRRWRPGAGSSRDRARPVGSGLFLRRLLDRWRRNARLLPESDRPAPGVKSWGNDVQEHPVEGEAARIARSHESHARILLAGLRVGGDRKIILEGDRGMGLDGLLRGCKRVPSRRLPLGR